MYHRIANSMWPGKSKSLSSEAEKQELIRSIWIGSSGAKCRGGFSGRHPHLILSKRATAQASVTTVPRWSDILRDLKAFIIKTRPSASTLLNTVPYMTDSRSLPSYAVQPCTLRVTYNPWLRRRGKYKLGHGVKAILEGNRQPWCAPRHMRQRGVTFDSCHHRLWGSGLTSMSWRVRHRELTHATRSAWLQNQGPGLWYATISIERGN